MQGQFFKIVVDGKSEIQFTKKKILTVKSLFLFLSKDIRKKILETDNVEIKHIKDFYGTTEEMETERDKLRLKNDPPKELKKQIYNKRYYQKSKEKYKCECGSTMVNRKQVIDKHNLSKKHLKHFS
jgi:hypothetical protein